MKTTNMIQNAISAVLALGVTSLSPVTLAQTNPASEATPKVVHDMGSVEGMEKCYGVAKAGRNDCGTATHNCAGESKIDGDKTAWIHLPSGVCDKIVGGSKTPEKV